MKQHSCCFWIICVLSQGRKAPKQKNVESLLQRASRAAVVLKEGGRLLSAALSPGLVLIILTIKLKELKQSDISWKKKRGKKKHEGAGRYPLACAELSPSLLIQRPKRSRVAILKGSFGGLIPLWHPGARGRRDQRARRGSKMNEWLCLKFPEVYFHSVRISLQRCVAFLKIKIRSDRELTGFDPDHRADFRHLLLLHWPRLHRSLNSYLIQN